MLIYDNPLFIPIKKQSSECAGIISLLREISKELFKIIHKFLNVVDKLSSSSLCNYFYL